MSTLQTYQDEIVKELGLSCVDGAALVPIILGSDKTTVSVATGQNDFYPLYFSFRNAHNDLQQSHSGVLAPIAFLAIPKCESCPGQILLSLLILTIQLAESTTTTPSFTNFVDSFSIHLYLRFCHH